MQYQAFWRKFIWPLIIFLVILTLLRGLFYFAFPGLMIEKMPHLARPKNSRLIDRSSHIYSSISDQDINIMFLFFGTNHNRNYFEKNMQQCLSTLFENTAAPFINIHVFGDYKSFLSLQEILHKIKIRIAPKVFYHDLSSFPETIRMIKDIHHHIGKVKHQFSQPFFYLSLYMHKLLPVTVSRLIILDVDIVIKSDITRLYALFNEFKDSNVLGLARENQPTYRYMFYEFRIENPKTRIGEPPPNGLTGFNSGVVLLDLRKLRQSVEYKKFLLPNNLASLSRKYKFQGRLGDQDVFTLMSLELEKLFYILPCGWNRQLCKWWQKADFENIFNSYFECKEEIHILHGNCRTKIV